MTHDEKLALAKQRHGKPFKTETLIGRHTRPSLRLKEIIKKAAERKINECQATT